MINWRRPRVIAIIAAVLVVIGTGLAAEIAAVKETGSEVKVSEKRLGSAKPGPGAVVPVTPNGTPRSPNSSLACPPDDQRPTRSRRPGAAEKLVPTGATALTICRYQGMNPARGGAAFQLVGAAAVDSATTDQVAQALNAIKRLHGTTSISCPMDDGSAVIATFHYPSGVSNPVRVGTNGCQNISNGHVDRLGLDAAVVSELEHLAKPVKTQVATFKGYVRGCGGKAPGHCRIVTPTICTPKCHRATRVAASNARGRFLGQGRLRHSRFRFNVAAPGSYTLRMLAVNRVIAKVTVKARLGHTTPVVFTMPLK